MSIYLEKLPFYKISWLVNKWVLCGGADGCEIVHDAELGSDKPPPAPAQPKTPSTPSKPEPKPDPAMKMLDDLEKISGAFSRFKTWLDTPTPPMPPKQAPPSQQKVERVPPFDIQEIPATMRKRNMPVGAKLMERWFAGELNYSPDDRTENTGLNQDGKPYPPSMIDKTDITMKWALGFERAKSQYVNLVKNQIYIDKSLGKVIKILRRYPDRIIIDATKMYDDNIELIHRNLQFQLAAVDGSFSQKLTQALNRAVEDRGVPDELTANGK